MLVVVDWLCHDHVLVHEDDGKDLARCICTVSCSLVKGPARMEANLTCTIRDCINTRARTDAHAANKPDLHAAHQTVFVQKGIQQLLLKLCAPEPDKLLLAKKLF